MDIELLFKALNYIVLLPWFLLIFLPQWKGTQWMIEWKLPIVFLAIVYTWLLLADFWMGPQGSGIDFTSLQSIQAAFGRQEVMLIGWVHYLAFDLLVGMWESVDAQKNRLPHVLLIPCLILTLLYGPMGFVLYWGYRQYWIFKRNKTA